jgi:hypothetical protein
MALMNHSPEISRGIMNLGPESGYGIQELDSPEVDVKFTNQIQRTVVGLTNKNPEVGCGIKEPKAGAWC